MYRQANLKLKSNSRISFKIKEKDIKKARKNRLTHFKKALMNEQPKGQTYYLKIIIPFILYK